MTVYSINKGVLEQAINPAPSSKTATSPEAAFAAALQKASLRFGGNDDVQATSAFKEHFARSVDDKRAAKAPEHGDRQPRLKTTDRADAPRQAERTERRADRPADDRVEQPAEDRSNEPAAVEDAPADDGSHAEAKSEASPEKPAETTKSDTPATQEAGGTTTEAPTAAPTDQNSQVAQTMVQPDTAVLLQNAAVPPQNAASDTNQGPVVQPDADSGDAVEGREGQMAVGDTTGDGAGADDTLPTAGPASDTEVDEAQTAAPQTAQAQAKPGAAKQAAGNTELAQRQADEMADMLAGTGAAIKVKVTTDKPAAEAGAEINQAEPAATAADLLLAQDVGADTAGDSQPRNGQGQASGQQNGQGIANAAQQVAGNSALENARAAQGKAMDARPFAAALAAQAEASSTTQAAQSNAGGQTQAVAGVTGTTAAQAAQKGAAAQAAHAPHQPRAVEPKQVIDQISVQIGKQAKDGGDTIKVQLKPADLGSIEIKLEIQDGRVTTHVTADNKDTLAALQRDARGLEKALQDAGLKTEQGAMAFSLSGEGKQAQQESGQQARSGRRSRLARAHEASEIGAQAAAQPLRAGGRSGVDIRV